MLCQPPSSPPEPRAPLIEGQEQRIPPELPLPVPSSACSGLPHQHKWGPRKPGETSAPPPLSPYCHLTSAQFSPGFCEPPEDPLERNGVGGLKGGD